jgi:hypothetical protein
MKLPWRWLPAADLGLPPIPFNEAVLSALYLAILKERAPKLVLVDDGRISRKLHKYLETKEILHLVLLGSG